MNRIMKFVLAVLAMVSAAMAFAPVPSTPSFLTQQQQHQRPGRSSPSSASPRLVGGTELYMGGKKAKFGIFSPAVYAGKLVLGQDRLNKIRGKAISLHSQQISDFTEWVGAYHLRTRLIKKAKENGDTLGFLV